MMKNSGQIALLSITILFIGLMMGIYIGNSTSRNHIKLTYDPTAYSDGIGNDNIRPPIVKININTATVEELTILPGIGESSAKQIVEYRQNNGPFYSIDDLKKVKGVSHNRLKEIRKYITVGG